MSRRRFTKEFKVSAARRLVSGESGSALARELDVKRTKLYEWAVELDRYGAAEAFPGPGRRRDNAARVEPGREDEARVAALERKVGQQALELDFLRQALRRVEDLRPKTSRTWRRRIGDHVRSATPQGRLSVRQMCRLVGLSRAGFYREPRQPDEYEMNLRAAPRHKRTGEFAPPSYSKNRVAPNKKSTRGES